MRHRSRSSQPTGGPPPPPWGPLPAGPAVHPKAPLAPLALGLALLAIGALQVAMGAATGPVWNQQFLSGEPRPTPSERQRGSPRPGKRISDFPRAPRSRKVAMWSCEALRNVAC